MNRTRLGTLALAGLTAIAAMAADAAADARELKLSTQVAAPHPFVDMAEHFAEEVEKRTNGELTVKVFTGAALGKDPAVINEMRIGTVDFIISSTNNAAKLVPQFQIFSLYYMFPDYDAFNSATAADSPVFEKLQSMMEEKGTGLRLLALGGSGTRNLSNAVKPVNGIEDVEGFKMRVPPSPVVAESWKAFGTLPVTVAWPELYAAIQTGVAEALESTVSGYTGSKLYEVAPLLARTRHSINANYFAMSQRSYDKLTDAQKKIVDEVAQEASRLGTEKGIEYEDRFIQELQDEHGVTVTEPDVSGFVEAIQPLHDSFAAEMDATELLELIRGLKS